MSILQKLKQQSKNYLKSSIQKNTKQKNFVENIAVLNSKSGEISNLTYDFEKKQYDDYLWIVFQSIYLQNKMEKEGNKVAYFITQTLPTQYHPYHTHDRYGKRLKRPIHNKKYDPALTIGKGYKELNNAFRGMIKDFKIDNEYNRLYYQKVLEPHKSFVPHLHALIYVEEENAQQFEEYFASRNSSSAMGRYECKRVDNIKRSSTYLLKYISKSIDPKNTNGLSNGNTNGSTFHGWKTTHKIRAYTYSQVSIPRYIFSKVSNVIRLEIQNNDNILEVIESLIDIQINNINEHGVCHTECITQSNSRYEVVIDKQRVVRHEGKNDYSYLLTMDRYKESSLLYLETNDKTLDEFYDNMTLWRDDIEGIDEIETFFMTYINGFLVYDYKDCKEESYEDNYLKEYEYLCMIDEQINVVSYVITNFTIYDKKKNTMIYDKSDYEIYSMKSIKGGDMKNN